MFISHKNKNRRNKFNIEGWKLGWKLGILILFVLYEDKLYCISFPLGKGIFKKKIVYIGLEL